MDWRDYRRLPESARQPPNRPLPPLPSQRPPPLVSRWSPSSSEETLPTPPLDESTPWPRDDRQESDREASDQEESDREGSDREESDREESDREESDRTGSDRQENIVIPTEEPSMSPAMRAARSLQRATGTLIRTIWRQLHNAFDLAARARRETRMRALGWRRLPDEERQRQNVISRFSFRVGDEGSTDVDAARKETFQQQDVGEA